jgi:hypothetical protein
MVTDERETENGTPSGTDIPAANSVTNGIQARSRRGRKRIYANDAARQRAYRERFEAELRSLQELRAAWEDACHRGRSGLMEHLPDEPLLWVPELIQRLSEGRIVFTRPETTPRARDRGRKR